MSCCVVDRVIFLLTLKFIVKPVGHVNYSQYNLYRVYSLTGEAQNVKCDVKEKC